MRSRKFRKRVEIWQTLIVADGFGGNTVSDTLLTRTWADISTLGIASKFSSRANSFGLNEHNSGILITMRKRNDLVFNSLNQYIVYNGVKYIISNNPTNSDFNNNIIEIVASRETQRDTNTTPPIGGSEYPYTYNFIYS